MKIIKISSNECGGFRPPKGHLDTQMFPECEGTPCDRNIVKKTVEKRKKNKKKADRSDDFYKISMTTADKLILKISLFPRESILQAIKNVGEESTAGFSEVTLDEIDAVLSLCDDGKLQDILNSLMNKNQKIKPEKPEPEIELAFADKKNDIVTSKKKKKKWNPNPWAVCNATVDKDKNPEKFERCVQDVKKKQAFNLKEFLKYSSNEKNKKRVDIEREVEDSKKEKAQLEWEKESIEKEAKKKNKYKHSPKEHGFMDECMDKNKDKGDPGAYCASIVDKVKGTTKWRGENR